MAIDYSGYYPTYGGTDYPTQIQSLIDALTLDVGSLMAAPFNALVNGDFNIWQRGSATTTCSAGVRTFLADRWAVLCISAAGTCERSTTVPTGSKAHYSLQIDGATGITTIDVLQRIEARMARRLKGKVSFTATVYNGTGAALTPQLYMQTANTEDTFSAVTTAFTVNLSSCPDATWTTVTYTGDWSSYGVERGVQVGFRFPSGSVVASDTVRITELALVPSSGSVAHDFWVRSLPEELLLAQRYYQKSYAQSSVPGAVTPSGAVCYRASVTGVSGSAAGVQVRFSVVMRTTPTITFYNPSGTGTAWRNISDSSDSGASSASAQQDAGFYASNAQHADDELGDLLGIHWTADAEL